MGKLYDELSEDYRIKEGLKTCINCGTCTAICPAAEFYRYDPRKIVDTVQRKDDTEIEALLKSDTIWYCGECMSCVTRCPRKNGAGLVIMALRNLSIKKGCFTESEKGRQVFPLTRILTGNILNYGYCVHPKSFKWEDHPESGPVWKWHTEHLEDSLARIIWAKARESCARYRRSHLTNSRPSSTSQEGLSASRLWRSTPMPRQWRWA